MNWNRILVSTFLVIVLCAVIYSCGGGGGGAPTAETPTATAIPADTATISDSTTITLQFSAAMNPATLILTGTMEGESDGGVWSTTTLADDTLTFSPLTFWNEAPQTLIMDVETMDGVSLPTLTLNYTVDASLTLQSVAPGNNSFITGSEPIIISFNETVDVTTLAASGSLWTEGRGAWSAAATANDTLTISPVTSWTEGAADLTLDIDDLVGNALTQLNLAYTVDLTPPVGTPTPAHNTTLYTSENIVVGFDESMDPATDIYAGTLPDFGSPGWSTTTYGNDTLTISPSSVWPVGMQTLDLTAADLAGNATSLNLIFNVAVLPTCIDGSKNSDETDIDCGGSTCSPCADGLSCNTTADCSSNVCAGGICQTPTCTDSVTNGVETDTDCGNGCPPCASGSGCDDSADCISGICIGGVCQADIDGDGWSVSTGDCDDANSAVHPGAAELCNGIDDDCDGQTDEDFAGLGDVCSVGTGICQSSGTMICDVSGTLAICSAIPGTPDPEICDTLDNDCDGQVDEASDMIAPACPKQQGVCEGSRVSTCSSGVWDACDATNYGLFYEAIESTCDGLDNDCDGLVDENSDSYDDVANCTRYTCSGATGWTALPLAASTICRAATGPCDVAETCNGTSTGCPADAVQIVGASCSDGDACNGSETCDGAGMCTGGTALICDDNNDCTNDYCSAATGCYSYNVVFGASCSDGNACTANEVCDGAGACTGGTSLICDDGNQCTTDSCSASTGACLYNDVPDATACDDGNASTTIDFCAAGTCVGLP